MSIGISLGSSRSSGRWTAGRRTRSRLMSETVAPAEPASSIPKRCGAPPAASADSPAAGGSGKGSARPVAAVSAMLAGALAGALMLKTSLVLPLVAAAALALVTWLRYVPAARRRG